MYQIIYNNKLKHKCTLAALDPTPLYLAPIQAKGYFSLRDTCLDLYSYLSILRVLYLAAYGTLGHLSVLCSVGQLPTYIIQC